MSDKPQDNSSELQATTSVAAWLAANDDDNKNQPEATDKGKKSDPKAGKRSTAHNDKPKSPAPDEAEDDEEDDLDDPDEDDEEEDDESDEEDEEDDSEEDEDESDEEEDDLDDEEEDDEADEPGKPRRSALKKLAITKELREKFPEQAKAWDTATKQLAKIEAGLIKDDAMLSGYKGWDQAFASKEAVGEALKQFFGIIEKQHGKTIAELTGVNTSAGSAFDVTKLDAIGKELADSYQLKADQDVVLETIQFLKDKLGDAGGDSAKGDEGKKADDPRIDALTSQIDELKQLLSERDGKRPNQAKARQELREAARKAMPRVRRSIEAIAPGFKEFTTKDVIRAMERFPDEENVSRAVKRHLKTRLMRYRDRELDKADKAPVVAPKRSNVGKKQLTLGPGEQFSVADALGWD